MEVEHSTFQPDWPVIVVIEGEPLTRTTKVAKMLAKLCKENELRPVLFPSSGRFDVEGFYCSLTLDAVDGAVNIFDRLHISTAAKTTRNLGAVTENVEAIEALLDGMLAIKVKMRLGKRQVERPESISPTKFKRIAYRWRVLDEFVSGIEGCRKYEEFNDDGLFRIAESIMTLILKLKGAQ